MAVLQVGAMPVRKMGTLDITFRVFLRVVAFAAFMTGLRYWAGLIGYWGEGMSRFDLLPPHWQVAAAGLAVLMPVAAVGLWMEVSWGAVIWVVAAGAEVVMHEVLPEWYGARPVLVIQHAAVAAVYVVFRIAFAIRERHYAQAVRADLP